MCKIDRYLEEKFEDDIELEAMIYIEKQKKVAESSNKALTRPASQQTLEQELKKVKVEVKEIIKNIQN